MPDDPLAWETLSSDVAYDCPGFSIRHEAVRLPDGRETDFDFLSEQPAVVVLPLTDDGDVVVIEEWRQAVKRVNRGIPVGSVEPEDEDLEVAARRELREETGHEADAVEPLLSTEPVNGIADTVLHYFLATGCEPTAEQDLDENETIRVDTAPLEDLREDALAGELRDGRAVTALCYHAMREQLG